MSMHCPTGQILRGEELAVKETSLEIVFSEKGWPMLWRCPSCGAHWETTYDGRYLELTSVECLAYEAVEGRLRVLVAEAEGRRSGK